MKITGIMVYYYFVCQRKLWYFSKGVTMESNSEMVAIGDLIHQNSYQRERKSILIDEIINIDFIKDWKIIHEVKKSDKLEEASIWQLKYYLWVLSNKGISIEKGILDYPKLKKNKEVYLTQEDKQKLPEILKEIKVIVEDKLPPIKNKKAYCRKCSYFELCFI